MGWLHLPGNPRFARLPYCNDRKDRNVSIPRPLHSCFVDTDHQRVPDGMLNEYGHSGAWTTATFPACLQSTQASRQDKIVRIRRSRMARPRDDL